MAVLVAVTLGLAPSAHADDMFDIDARLDDEGFSYAYTEVLPAGSSDGIRVQVDYESDSTTRQEYEQEAAQLARIIWLNLDGRVLAVDVLTTYEVSWTAGGLPPAVSFDLAQLQQAHGDRPAGLDEGDPFGEFGAFDDFGFMAAGIGMSMVFVLVPIVLVLLLLAAAVGITVAVVRRKPQPSGAWAGAPGGWPAGPPPWPGQPPHGAQQPWPGPFQAPAAPPAAPWPPQDWARPPG